MKQEKNVGGEEGQQQSDCKSRGSAATAVAPTTTTTPVPAMGDAAAAAAAGAGVARPTVRSHRRQGRRKHAARDNTLP